MNITLHIEAKSPDELQEAIAGLAGIVGCSVVAPQVEPEKAKRSSLAASPKPETEKQPDPKRTVESDSSEETTKETTNNVEEEVIPTVVELRAVAQAKGQTAEGKKAIKALLDEFECKSISNVPEEVRVAFMRKLEALKV